MDVVLTPEDLLRLTEKFAGEIGTTLFYSGGSFDSAQNSYLCLFPYEFLWTKKQKLYHHFLEDGSVHTQDVDNPWDGLKGYMPGINRGSSHPDWVGYFGYEMGCFSDPEKRLPYHCSSIPDSFFMRPSCVVALDHRKNQGTILIHKGAHSYLSKEQRDCLDHLPTLLTDSDEPRPKGRGVSWRGFQTPLNYSELKDPPLKEGVSSNFDELQRETSPLSLVTPGDPPYLYHEKVEAAQELIRSGDIYQVNLSQQFAFQGTRDPFQLFCQIAKINPAPFMAYSRFPQFAVISSSPERFLSKNGGVLETRPIKGTAPRGASPEEDSRNRERLLSSSKERAELLMITDLMRNDLAKVSIAGSVETEEIWKCEAYTNVFHLLSIIRSSAKTKLHSIDILRSCFPGGSITGCPKLRAMGVISDLEKRARGIYTGSIGYLAANGDFDFNIAIRTLLWTSKSIEVALGGAIVADSDPAHEYEETLHKGASLFKALSFEG